MKVLAVDQVLSLQVHPGSEQARRGHAREEAAGLPLDSPERSYPDPWHKPELVFALTPFETLVGFRDVSHTADLLRMLGVPWADDVARRLEDGDPAVCLRAVVEDTLALPGSEVEGLVAEVSAARGRVRYADPEAHRVLEILGQLANRYPDDPGVLVSLLLNDVVLQPGEALMVQPGVVHAHGSGLALEIMATSDNVLRAGLTPKHRDVAELVAATDFRPIPPPRCPPQRTAPGFAHFAPPVEEFELTVARPPVDALPSSGPRVLVALDGAVEVTAGGETARGPAGTLGVRRARRRPDVTERSGLGGDRRRTATTISNVTHSTYPSSSCHPAPSLRCGLLSTRGRIVPPCPKPMSTTG